MKSLTVSANCLRATASILGASVLALTCAPVAQAQPVITNAPGYVITWDGNNGDNPTSPNVPVNIASASQGAIAYASGQLGPEIGAAYHYTANLNDGFYGNTKSWIGGTNDPTPWFAGIQLTNVAALTGIAWSRDNTGASQDRWIGTYTLQISTNASFTTNAAAWTTVGTITYTNSAVGFSPWLRHRYQIAAAAGGVIPATSVRLLVPDSGLSATGTALDELELFGSATVNLAYWRMGENDPGAANGLTNFVTVNLLGSPMALKSNAVYSSSVASTAALRVGSSLALQFTTGRYATNQPAFSVIDNFGLELWVKPDATNATQCLAYNGDSGPNGWGLYLHQGKYQGLFGGLAFLTGPDAVPGEWTHLALVRNNGLTTLYVNGVTSATSPLTPGVPTGRFALAAQPQTLTTEFCAGSLDEVRVFTFVPGAFVARELLLNRNLVTSLADAGPDSLRQVITDLNIGGLPGIITLNVTGTITLASDLPVCTVPVNITGPGTNLLTISGGNSFRLLRLSPNTTNSISGLTLANGFTANDNSGSALYNLGYTIMTNCRFASNTVVGGFGGAVANFGAGTLLATNCTFEKNTVRGGNGVDEAPGSGGGPGGAGAGMGGAVYTEGTALTVSGCTFQNNLAAGGNGGNGGPAAQGANGGRDGGYPNRGLGQLFLHLNGGAGGFGGGGGGSSYGGGFGGTGGFGGGGGGSYENFKAGVGGQFGGNASFTTNNFMGGGGGGAGLGASLFARSGAVSVVNCAFNNNLATNGVGGVGYTQGANGHGVGGAVFSLVTPTLTGSTFNGNDASTAAPNSYTPASFIVTNLADNGAGTLRELVSYANTNADANEIFFLPSLSGQTITLTSGQLTLSNTVTIDGSRLASGIQINGNATTRIFNVPSGSTVVLDSLTLTNGRANGGSGGGILNAGNLMVNRCTLVGNKAGFYGGGIENNGSESLVINQSTFTANQCLDGGGAALDVSTGPVTVQQCTMVGNVAIHTSGIGGIGNYSSGVTVYNSIIAGNSSAGSTPNIGGNTMTFTGVNLTDGNPLLAPLGNYGGTTQTMPPLPGSPALNAATNGTSFTTDQRGQPRIVGTFADLGAVEGTFNPNYPIVNVTKLGSGNVQFAFNNLSGPSYRVLASTNVAAPLNTWSNLDVPLESPAGTFTFTDLQATNYPSRFYRVTTP